MGNNRQVILKIFRLDKNIYNELASEVSNFQIAIAIYISGFLFSGLAALNFLRNSLVYLEENLGLIVGTLPAQTVNELNNLIREFENVFNSQQLFGLLTSYLISSFVSGFVGVGLVYLLLTRFFRKETDFRQVGIIYGFSNIPVFFKWSNLLYKFNPSSNIFNYWNCYFCTGLFRVRFKTGISSKKH